MSIKPPRQTNLDEPFSRDECQVLEDWLQSLQPYHCDDTSTEAQLWRLLKRSLETISLYFWLRAN